jgi:hypothetical protein
MVVSLSTAHGSEGMEQGYHTSENDLQLDFYKPERLGEYV